jgi:small subunit ribosomal protein S18
MSERKYGHSKDKDKEKDNDRSPMGMRRGFSKRKVCRFCADKIRDVDYKDFHRLNTYVTDRGKIVPARISGACARHQRQLTRAVKFNRNIGLIGYSVAPPANMLG